VQEHLPIVVVAVVLVVVLVVLVVAAPRSARVSEHNLQQGSKGALN